jgi:dipeptidyl aminopeptidase/acylaminoacyl peptidase
MGNTPTCVAPSSATSIADRVCFDGDLASGFGDVSMADWSPDGRWLVLRGSSNSSLNLVSTTDPTAPSVEHIETGPVYSGSQWTGGSGHYVFRRADGTYVLDTSGSVLSTATALSGDIPLYRTDPQGESLAFVLRPSSTEPKIHELVVRDLDASVPDVVLDGATLGGPLGEFAWSHTADWLAFVVKVGDDELNQLEAITPDGTTHELIGAAHPLGVRIDQLHWLR